MAVVPPSSYPSLETSMSLLLKRLFPPAAELDGNVASFQAAVKSVDASQRAGRDPAERFAILMDHGVTIFLPGEHPDPFVTLRDATPFVARFGQLTEGMDASDPRHEDKARAMLQVVFRSILRRMRSGSRLEVMDGRFWQLMKPSPLLAELVGKPPRGGLLLEERIGSANKPLPDAIYCLQRIDQHRFLLEVMEEPEGEPDREGDVLGLGGNHARDIRLTEISGALGGGFDATFEDEDAGESPHDEDPWKE